MRFSITYEHAKKILEVFYNSPYSAALPYIEILHDMKEASIQDSPMSSTPNLKERLDEEKSKADNKDKIVEEAKEE